MSYALRNSSIKPSDELISIQLRAPKEFYIGIDRWRAKQDDVPNRNEAIRRMVIAQMEGEGIKIRKRA